MKSLIPVIYALMIFPAGIGSAQSEQITGDLVINIRKSEASAHIEKRLAALLTRQLKTEKRQAEVEIVFFDGSTSEMSIWLADKKFEYVVQFEVSGGWTTHRRMAVPFILNLYQRSYTLKIFALVFSGEDGATFFDKYYEISLGGPKAWQIFESNSHDGSLTLSSGEQLEIESKAEEKIVEKMAGDLRSILKKIGDG